MLWIHIFDMVCEFITFVCCVMNSYIIEWMHEFILYVNQMNWFLYKCHRIGYKKSTKKSTKKSKKNKSPSISHSPPKKKNKILLHLLSNRSLPCVLLPKNSRWNQIFFLLLLALQIVFRQLSFVMINYNPKLGDFTNKWDMVNDDGVGLHIGVIN